MKKIILTAVLTCAATIALTGCFQSPQAEPQQPEQKTEVKEEVAACTKLIDGSCEPVDALVYNNEENPVYFKYPAGWVIKKEETITHGDKAVLVVTFENSNNKDAVVQFRKYMPENAAKMGWVSDENHPAGEYETAYYKIIMNYLKEDEQFAKENGINLTGDRVNYTRLTPVDPASDLTPEFMLSSPAENFDEYNKFVILAASTIK